MDHDHVRATITMVQSQIQELEKQLTDKRKIVNGLCGLMGEPPAYADAEPATNSHFGIQGDVYFRKPLATAVRDILVRRKSAGLGSAPIDTIFDLMKMGGFVFDAKSDLTARRSLVVALSKNPVFVKLPNDDVGLAEWYGDAKGRSVANGGKKDRKAAESQVEEDEAYVNEFADGASSDELEEAISGVPAKG